MRIPVDEADLHFIAGQRSVLLGQLRLVLSELGYESTEARLAKWVLEREETVAKLRSMCADLGDNDWSDDLYLSDVIDKHLWKHMETR